MAAPSATSAASGRPRAAPGLVASRSAAAWLSASTFERASTTSIAVARRSRMAAESGAPPPRLQRPRRCSRERAAVSRRERLRALRYRLRAGFGGCGFGVPCGLCGELIEGWRTWKVVCWLVITGLPSSSRMLARRKYAAPREPRVIRAEAVRRIAVAVQEEDHRVVRAAACPAGRPRHSPPHPRRRTPGPASARRSTSVWHSDDVLVFRLVRHRARRCPPPAPRPAAS